MSADKKKMLEDLNEKIVQTEQLKSGIMAECSEIDRTLSDLLDTYTADSGDNLEKTLKSFQSFLNSTNNTLKSIQTEVRTVAGNAQKISLQLNQISQKLS